MATVTLAETIRNLEDILNELGAIAPNRIRLRMPLGSATEADLIALNGSRETICELVDGLLVEKAMGYKESNLAVYLMNYLLAFIDPRNLGILTGEAGMMRLAPGLVRIPDIAFASWDRIPGQVLPKTPIAGFAPDLAIEILSRSNTKTEMARKRREYFQAGVRLVWLVDPVRRTVAVFDAPENSILIDESQTLNGGEVLPGFTLTLSDLFGKLDRRGTRSGSIYENS